MVSVIFVALAIVVRAPIAQGLPDDTRDTATTPTAPKRDVTAPSAPTLTATAVSFDRIDLSWTASTGDVEVAGYVISRDGQPLAAVDGATTTYRDTDVVPSTGYDYAVRAVDADGNVSEPSPTASATTHPRTVFLDGFESGDLSQWTGGSGLAVEEGYGFAGRFAARATTTGPAMYRYKQLSTSHTELSYHVRFKLLSQTGSVSLLKLRTAAGSPLARLWLTASGQLATRNDMTGVSTESLTQITPESWYAARFRVLVGGADSRIDVWLDGAQVDALSKPESLGTNPIGRIQLGDEASGKAYDVIYDDVAVDVRPTNTAVPSISGIARQGKTLTADPGAWSGTEPISYTYQWRRCDLTKLNCKSIAGATAQSYTLTWADAGSTIRVRAIATNVAGTTIAFSQATPPVSPPCPGFEAKRQVGTVNFSEAVELSGIAASRRNPGVLWTHNDNGDTQRVFAMDKTAAYLGTYWVSRNLQADWEDIAVGPGPDDGMSYLYIGDVGGNQGRHWVSIYRAPEPEVSPSQTPVSVSLQSVVRLPVHYPGVEEYNAESLIVDPQNHDIYVVTKANSGVAKVFRYPAAEQNPAVAYELERVGTLQLPGPATAADISPDGREVVIKGMAYSKLWARVPSVPIALALTPTPCWIPHGRGEAIGFAADGSGYFTVAEGDFQPLYWFARR